MDSGCSQAEVAVLRVWEGSSGAVSGEERGDLRKGMEGQVICTDCTHSIHRVYRYGLDEKSSWYCCLDGTVVDLRMVRCSRRDYGEVRKLDVVLKEGVEAALEKIDAVTPDRLEAVMKQDEEFKKKGWPLGKKRK